MQQSSSQCTNCGAFARRSLHHEEEYQSSVLLGRLRTSNLPATDQELTHIRETILPTVSNDISSIESKVAALREVIRSMEAERDRLNNIQKKYSHLISLHRTLPFEISEIFLYTIPEAGNSYMSYYSDSNALNPSGSMWLLSHVCQRWRNVVLSLRSFWSIICLSFPRAARCEKDVQRLEAVLQRSHQGLLDISISLTEEISVRHNPESNPSILKRILDIVVAESHRWRAYHLTYDHGRVNPLYASLHNRFPRLELVDLSCGSPQLDQHSLVSVFRDCPRLTKVFLSGFEIPLLVDFPWDQITVLDLSQLEMEGGEEDRRACLRLIGQCPLLETLATPSWDSEDEMNESYIPITCSNLRELDCTSVPVIDALTLPRLREASLRDGPTAAHYDILFSFKRLLIRSSCFCALTRLSLTDVPLATSPGHDLLSILTQANSLACLELAVFMEKYPRETVSIHNTEQVVAIVKSLEVIPTAGVLFLPLLSSLSIRVYDHSEPMDLPYFGPVGIFASMLRARWKGDNAIGLARLKTCRFTVEASEVMYGYIYWRPDVHIFNEAECSILTALFDDGMDLSIRVTSPSIEDAEGYKVVFAVPS